MSEARGARWQIARDLFERALELPEAEREAFLARHAGGDDDLRGAVKELLRADREAGAFLESPLGPPPGEAEHPAVDAGMPDRVGPYRVEREIGRGGTGAVFLARRDDETFHRRAVIKVVRADLRDEHLESRLRTERQVLAALDHPNIATVFDGGTMAGGAPYFVMEHIDGVPIDRFCDERRLTVDQRLTLFRDVCRAVHYAHQNLVIHRDLKPSNILVTASGTPKLLDFGIAKILNPSIASAGGDLTRTWQRILTPHYASPEQMRGSVVTTATDVYSLGVLLYRLLTGHLPHRFTGMDSDEIQRALAEHEPISPSTIVTRTATEGPTPPAAIAEARGTRSDRLRRRLAGDLDAIVLKALRSAPEQRYNSADRLAEDIVRHQQGLPVRARRGTWRYSAGKLLRRHRRASAAVVAVALAAIGFVGALALQSARLERERDQARRERDEKQSLLALFLDILRNVDPMTGGDRGTTLQDVLARSGPLIDQRLRHAPALRAETLHTLGVIDGHLGQMTRARDKLETALVLRRGLFGARNGAVGETMAALATTLAELGEPAAAELAAEAVAIQRAQPPGASARRDLARALIAQAGVFCIAGDFAPAEEPAAEALRLARDTPEPTLLADALGTQAVVDAYHGRERAAAAHYREALALGRATLGAGHLALVPILQSLGSVLGRTGQLDAADAALREALTIQQDALGDDSPSLVPTLANLAGVLGARGAHAEAAGLYRQALATIEATVGRANPRTLYLESRLADAELAAGDSASALALREQLPAWRVRLGDDHPFVALADGIVGAALADGGHADEAEALLVSSFQRLLDRGRARDRDEAFARLERFYGGIGGGERLDRYRALLAEKEADQGDG